MKILSIKDFIESANSLPIKVTIIIVITCLVLMSVLFIKEQLELRKKYKSLIHTGLRETPATMTMSMDELLSYFKSHYNFNIAEDSYKFVDKAKDLVNKVENIQIELNNDLLAAQSGVLINRSEVISKINEIGGLIDVVDNELDLMYRLFNHLKEHDETYVEELKDLSDIKDHYKTIEKRLLVLCLSLISEFPNN